MKFQLPRSTQNWFTLMGAVLALISLFMIVFAFTVSLFWKEGHAYFGLVTYILLPAVMVLGLAFIPIGMLLQMHRDRKVGVREPTALPRVDLNDPRHRNAFFIFVIGTTFLLFISAVGSYEAFHFTESNTFCGKLCHEVMHPEYIAYQNSPHAKVLCVECHVGPGADWYVRSKLSGAYQVYAILFNKYPKPIGTPIKNLRPAREVCEQCHWPQKFYAHKLRLESYFLPDEENTPWDLALIMKIGSPRAAHGLEEGIHWHINPNVKIEYIASDETREHLPWVRYTNLRTGEVVVYNDEDESLDEEEIQTREIRVMDCIDCHTRPSHNYRAPIVFVNQAMVAGEIPPELPEIKSLSMEICDNDYTTTDSAMKSIEKQIREFYEDNYPEIYEEQQELVEKAVAGLQDVFSKNIFPEMKVKWSAYPDHIGHMNYDGCFRCHNDRHTSEAGDVISKDCNLCHYISAQGPKGNVENSPLGQFLEFKHPEDIDEEWKESLCTDCHEGI
jgi:hypothetical protein